MTAELAVSVKNYQINNSQSYNEAMKRTGPIQTSGIYKNLPKVGRNAIFNMEDKYWRDLIDKNYRIQDSYKIPSAMAWDYNEYGIFDEMIDMKSMHKMAMKLDKMVWETLAMGFNTI